MSSVLAVDIGRTGCRVALWCDAADTPAATASGEGSIGLGAMHGAQVAEAAILAVARPLLKTRAITCIDAVGVGAPGAMKAPAAAHELAERLTRSLPARMASVTSDAITSHAGALAGAPGVVLAAGTGAVVVAIDNHRRLHQVDGWGPWLGDEGSGAWLGRHGLQAAARADDGRGPATALSDAAVHQFGSLGELAMQLSCDPNPARTMAAFVPAIAAAAGAGDAVALALLEACASRLADAMRAAVRQLNMPGPTAAAIIGGLTSIGPVLLKPLRARLADRCNLVLQPAHGTSLDGARRVAGVDAGIHRAWVLRAQHADGVDLRISDTG